MASLALAWQALRHYRWRNGLLVLALLLCGLLPWSLHLLIDRAENDLMARAEMTPLVIGAQGSPLELVLASTYLSRRELPPLPFGTIDDLLQVADVAYVPMLQGHHSQGASIVGCDPGYLRHRALQLGSGRPYLRIGECVLGAALASRRDLEVGDTLVSSPVSAFDLTGGFPLELRVVGVLAPTATVEDEVVLCSLETAWVLEGQGHGHADLQRADDDVLFDRTEDSLVANAAVHLDRRLSHDTVHFHADRKQLPLSAILAFPANPKANTLLQGHVLTGDQGIQVVVPSSSIAELFATIATVETWIQFGLGIALLATLLIAVLVIAMSLKQREMEFRTMYLIGADRFRIAGIIAWEIALLLLLVAIGLAIGLSLLLLFVDHRMLL